MDVNSTTATPSLNNDSPAIFSSSESGIPVFLRIANTAMGSVGEIREPKRRQMIKGIGVPKSEKSNQKAAPAKKVDISVPAVASTRIGHFCAARRCAFR